MSQSSPQPVNQAAFSEGTLQSSDGTKLYYRQSEPSTAAVGQVLLLHGYAEHVGRYTPLMQGFADVGLRTLALDFRGHGKSAGSRGHITSFDEYLADVRAGFHKLAGNLPIIVMGHSMGGLVATVFALQNASKVHGLMLSSPFFGRALKVNPLKLLVGEALGVLAPKFSLPSGITGNMLTHDPVEARKYEADPLHFGNVTAGWFRHTSAAQVQVEKDIVRLQLPLYVNHGELDPVASFPVARALYERAESRDKKFVARPGMLHETLNEIGREQVVKDFAAWAREHV